MIGLSYKALRRISICPFVGFSPREDLVKLIASPLYDVINSSEAKNFAKGNEYSFLHCTKPEIDIESQVGSYDKQIYSKGKSNLSKFINNNWLLPDTESRIYIYSIRKESHIQYGVLCGSSVSDYESKIIKTHELTREVKVQDRFSLIQAQNANTEPVMFLYKHNKNISNLISQITSNKPFITYLDNDNSEHCIWKSSQNYTKAVIEEFAKVPFSYVADGHHRTEASARLGKLRRKNGIPGDSEYFLSLLFPDNQLQVMEYNRVIKQFPSGVTSKSFIKSLEENFCIFTLDQPVLKEKNTFAMYIEGKWIGLRWVGNDKNQDLLENIDSYILTKYCLKPLLGIEDISKSENIEFIGGIRGSKEIVKKCNEGFAVGFVLRPVSVQDIIDVSDSGLIMPPKSTWFEPKPRSGLVVRLLDNF
ncbi:hypothetical protein SteCoe_14398 [Stentor coeruleus]|uniref:DUF1015 domain-containing protein n=1 Tax=Stentor coeruleus TaxID=5963 RepID=A0A1R2C6A8_9CILI|nr:hypothetical protein SteCoe_15298 [Stentor coeruleus]OMJ84509.1 hypothetical protein SteCoe_14398 [Stentor coeruleus]